MCNKHIESLVFEASTLDGLRLRLSFHDISQINTMDNVFFYNNGIAEPIACQYDSLHLLEPEEVMNARLKALNS